MTWMENWMEDEWAKSPRWDGIRREYTVADVYRLRGPRFIHHTVALGTANKFWDDCREAFSQRQAVRALGALTGNQAIQQAQAGLKAIYASGWQVAADANRAGCMYPDLSLYPSDSMANLVRSLNAAMLRAEQIEFWQSKGTSKCDLLRPIVADAEAGFGGVPNTYEIVCQLIAAGAAAVHLEDQLSSAKKCGHLGGKVLVPVREFVEKLKAARLASDVMGVPSVIIARTDADSAKLLTSDIDPVDHPFLVPGDRTSEGFYRISGGVPMAIARGLAYAPYADLLWMETSTPDLDEARLFADAIHAKYPNKMLAYNCSPSFNWGANVDKSGPLDQFQLRLAEMGYAFQFVTLAGFHSLNLSMFNLASGYLKSGMVAYSEMQEQEFKAVENGFTAVKHQAFVGTGYYDAVKEIVSGGQDSTAALKDSTEAAQF